MNILKKYNEFINEYWSKWYLLGDILIFTLGIILENDCLKAVGTITWVQDLYIYNKRRRTNELQENIKKND